MPINIPDALPAKDILESEKIFAIEDKSAHRQRIRPLKIVILNLMPKKIETETQILRLISKSALQVDIDFMMVKNHVSKNTSQDHLVKFYTYFEKLKDNYYDGMIITGAPVEHLEYEDVDSRLLYITYMLGSTGWTLLSLWSSKAYLARKSIWHLPRTISR